jgi:exosome complex component RRP46
VDKHLLRAHTPTTPHIARIDAMAVPEVTLTHLNRADGSATYTHNGYSLIGAVNGPIEVLRRDEMPEEATIEVNIRPAVGVGSMNSPHT